MDDDARRGRRQGPEARAGAEAGGGPAFTRESAERATDEVPEPATETGTERLVRPRRPRTLRPWDALERLDRQWEDRTPLGKSREPVTSLALAVPEDPFAFDYLGTLTGASRRKVAEACSIWLETQLAADALELGRILRPTVELVPAGRLWYVVRTVADAIVVIDSPGFISPLTAVVAAHRRYRAALLAELEAPDAGLAAIETESAGQDASGDAGGAAAGEVRRASAPAPVG